jgi:NADH:ubiquinone oxidoreductase subunit K
MATAPFQSTIGAEARPAATADRILFVLIPQGLYFFATGVWPLVHMESFLAVTGPKTDLWLVRTVGVLIAVIGFALLVAAFRRQTGAEVRTLAIGSALGLAAIDVIYVTLGVIPPVYLLDAVAEGVLITGWMLLLSRSVNSVTLR